MLLWPTTTAGVLGLEPQASDTCRGRGQDVRPVELQPEATCQITMMTAIAMSGDRSSEPRSWSRSAVLASGLEGVEAGFESLRSLGGADGFWSAGHDGGSPHAVLR